MRKCSKGPEYTFKPYTVKSTTVLWKSTEAYCFQEFLFFWKTSNNFILLRHRVQLPRELKIPGFRIFKRFRVSLLFSITVLKKIFVVNLLQFRRCIISTFDSSKVIDNYHSYKPVIENMQPCNFQEKSLQNTIPPKISTVHTNRVFC